MANKDFPIVLGDGVWLDVDDEERVCELALKGQSIVALDLQDIDIFLRQLKKIRQRVATLGFLVRDEDSKVYWTGTGWAGSQKRAKRYSSAKELEDSWRLAQGPDWRKKVGACVVRLVKRGA